MQTLFSTRRSLPLTLALAVLSGLALAPAHAQGPNLVTNPGFETGDFSGWTQGGNTAFTSVAAAGFDGFLPASGTEFAALGPTNTNGTLSQTLPTVADDLYQINFSLASDGGTPNNFRAVFGSETLASLKNIPSTHGNYLNFQGYAIGDGDPTPLKFTFRNNPGYLALDSVSVVDLDAAPSTPDTPGAPVPEASTTVSLGLLLMLGLGGLVIAAKRQKAARVA